MVPNLQRLLSQNGMPNCCNFENLSTRNYLKETNNRGTLTYIYAQAISRLRILYLHHFDGAPTNFCAGKRRKNVEITLNLDFIISGVSMLYLLRPPTVSIAKLVLLVRFTLLLYIVDLQLTTLLLMSTVDDYKFYAKLHLVAQLITLDLIEKSDLV